jgi:hypothetical protein
VSGKAKGARHANTGVLLVEKRFHTTRHRLSGVLFECRLGIKEIDLTGAAMLKQQDHSFGSRFEMRGPHSHIAPCFRFACQGPLAMANLVGHAQPPKAQCAASDDFTSTQATVIGSLVIVVLARHRMVSIAIE